MKTKRQTPKQTKRDPDSPEGITYIITPDKNVKPLSPEEEAEARKQAREYLLGPELKPHEKLELEEQAKASSSKLETLMRDIHRRCGVPIPFPLEDIYYYTDDTGGPPDGVYDHDDPEYLEKLSIAAFGAINDYRMFWYKPGLYCNKEQLKIATEIALDIRLERPNLRNIPFAENPDCPTDEDFIQLGQWFLDANTVIKAEIRKHRESTAEPTVSDAVDAVRGKPDELDKTLTQKTKEVEWSKITNKITIVTALGLSNAPKLNKLAEQGIYEIRQAGDNRQDWQIRIDKLPERQQKKLR